MAFLKIKLIKRLSQNTSNPAQTYVIKCTRDRHAQVASFQLIEVSLMISVYVSRAMKRNEIFGWISMGKNASSDFEDQHWKEMCDSPHGGAVSRWHTLIDT